MIKIFLFFIGIIIALGIFGLTFFRSSTSSSFITPASVSLPTIIPTPTLAPPQQLSIPKLNLTSQIEYVGLDANQRMDVPKDWNQVAWYQLGPKPGEQGSAVLAGHLDSPSGPAIFYNLNQLESGDLISVTNQTGQQLQFEVTDKATYPDASFPLAQVFSQTDAHRLNLITCTGQFDKQTKNYSDRLVVFTKLKS
jgi:LPXTG-site transpeptidase (sortase) family protein